MLSVKQIAKKKVQISELREQVESLQTPHVEPKADDYITELDFRESLRRWRDLESHRLDDLSTKTSFLNSQDRRLQQEIEELEPIKSRVDEGFVEYRAAALAANRILDEAEIAIQKVFELQEKQCLLGHHSVYDQEPLDIMHSMEMPIFLVSNIEGCVKIGIWGRGQYRNMKRDGGIGEGTET